MKRKCKNIDITDIDFIENAVRDSLRNKKKTRNDIQRIFAEYGTVKNIAKQLQKELVEEKLEIPKIWYKKKYDQGSRKWINIGIQDIKHQMFDYIAVNGLEELERRIGKYQCASIKGRGQIYCAHAIQNHIQDTSIKYAVQMDIKKYYESIPHDKLMEWLTKRVGNNKLLWLIERLIGEFDNGLSIGSYLSQHLGNLYLSDIYHMLENVHKTRRGQVYKIVSFQAFYMDDILFVGKNSRELIKVAQMIINELNKLGLDVKKNWSCFKIDDSFIDMVGFRIYRDHITVRRNTLKKIRRTYLRFNKNPHSLTRSRRIVSQYGILKHSNSKTFCGKYGVYQKLKKAKGVVSNADSLRFKNATS